MSKEIATKQNKELAELYASMGFNPIEDKVGVGSNLDKEDIVYGRIFLLQGNNPIIKEKKGAEGDFYDSLAEKAIGETVDLIFISSFKTWIIEDLNTPKKDTIAVIPFEEGNYANYENITWEGKSARAILSYNFYVLLADGEDPVPYIISLKKGVGGQTAKKLLTHFSKLLEVSRRPSFEQIFTLGSEIAKNPDGLDYLRITAKKSDKAPTIDQIKTSLEWAKMLANSDTKKQAAVLHNTEIEEDSPNFKGDVTFDASDFDD